MKITKSQLKQLIKEEVELILTTEQEEEVNMQNLEDTIIETIEKETAKAGTQAPLLLQLILTKLQEVT